MYFFWWPKYNREGLNFDDIIEIQKRSERFHKEFMQSIMLYMSTMHDGYYGIRKMPLKDFHIILNAKIEMEKAKSSSIDSQARTQIKSIENKKGMSGNTSPSRLGGI